VNDDYLWDRSGEPDGEVRELEEVLGALRYQPRPLEIPSDVRAHQRRQFFWNGAARFMPRLALAATLALLLLGAGVWLGIERRQAQPAAAGNALAVSTRAQPSSVPAPVGIIDERGGLGAMERASTEGPKQQGRRRANATLTLVRQREAKVAKDQLMFALRLVSAKLNFAQKKTLNTNPRDPVLNQHKIG
jgi:hypothetical protein